MSTQPSPLERPVQGPPGEGDVEQLAHVEAEVLPPILPTPANPVPPSSSSLR